MSRFDNFIGPRNFSLSPENRRTSPPRPVGFAPRTCICRTVKVSPSTREAAPDAPAGLTQHRRSQDGREEVQAEQEPCVPFHHYRESRTLTAELRTRPTLELDLNRAQRWAELTSTCASALGQLWSLILLVAPPQPSVAKAEGKQPQVY